MDFQRFLPISKVDEEKHMVYGYASTPDMDSDGEIISTKAMKQALPEYMKFPAIREMHQPKAAGKTIEATIDSKKGLYIGAKIVDKSAWEKVKEGVYPAFSIGGNIKQKIDNVISELTLTEISLVDSPANKSAVIELWKADGVDPVTGQMKSPYQGVRDARDFLGIASDLVWAFLQYKRAGKKTKEIERAIEALKAQAIITLNSDDAKKVDSVLNLTKKNPSSDDMQKLEHQRMLKSIYKPSVHFKIIKAIKEAQMKPKKTTSKKEEKEVTKEVEAKVEPTEPITDAPKEPEATSKLDKIVKSLEKPEEPKITKTDLLKADVAKVVSILEKLSTRQEEVLVRLEKLEAQPAITKTKISLVDKNFSGADTQETPEEDLKALDKINARLEELKIIREEDPGTYQSEGLENEAWRLLNKKSKLS